MFGDSGMIHRPKPGLPAISNRHFQPRLGGRVGGLIFWLLKGWYLTKGKELNQTDIQTEANMHRISPGDLPAHFRSILVEKHDRISRIWSNPRWGIRMVLVPLT